MAITYLDALSTDRDKVRLQIGDTQQDAGPRPDKRNFSDAEISFFVSDEGSVNGAIAKAFEILVAEWTPYALSEREADVAYDAKELVDKYRILAKEWRDKTGGGADTIYAGVISLDFQQKDTVND